MACVLERIVFQFHFFIERAIAGPLHNRYAVAQRYTLTTRATNSAQILALENLKLFHSAVILEKVSGKGSKLFSKVLDASVAWEFSRQSVELSRKPKWK